MKTKVFSLILIFMLVLTFAAPVSAFEDYGLIYDDTGALDSGYMKELSESALGSICSEYGVEVRVDIVTDLENYAIEDYAALFYDQYSYGLGDNGDGILLMLLVTSDGNGYAFGDYVLYTGGIGSEIFNDDIMTALKQSLDSFFTASAWEGDLAQDQTVCQSGLTAYAELCRSMIQSSGLKGEGEPQDTEPQDVSTISTYHIASEGGYLTEDEVLDLETKAAEISEKYNCGVYAVIVQDYTAYGSGSVYDYATEYYNSFGLGMGEGKDGILLLLSMADRDYALVCHGDAAHEAFSEYAQDKLSDAFLDDFGDDDWYGGMDDYITTAGEYLAMASDGTPMTASNDPAAQRRALIIKLAVVILVPLILALIVCLIFRSQMKPVKMQDSAGEYLIGGVKYSERSRSFSHETVTRVPLPKDDGDHHSGGGFSGKSGKF